MSTQIRLLDKLQRALQMVRMSELRAGWWPCSACGHRLQVHLRANELAVRCTRCGATPISQSIIQVIAQTCPGLSRLQVLELSARGVLAAWLQQKAATVVLSEYMPDQPAGTVINGVRNEDVQQLSFSDGTFDLVTSTEVFEHVADDARGFAQVHRVLRPGGVFVFTVPLVDKAHTRERAELREGKIIHHDTPEYHADSFSGSERVLCFRNYGRDIVERLRAAGFAQADMVMPALPMFGFARKVLVATRAE